ncbi:hypothetical protein SAMN04487821_113108 [Enterococcus malodoratus]|nr:hypothetical protein SAMN04487821_113108 [Enterococcus malodoratus]
MVLPRKIDHMQVTVRDINEVESFYDGLMEALGFDLKKKIKVYLAELDMNVIEYLDGSYDFGICSALKLLKTTLFIEENLERSIISPLEPPPEPKLIVSIKRSLNSALKFWMNHRFSLSMVQTTMPFFSMIQTELNMRL